GQANAERRNAPERPGVGPPEDRIEAIPRLEAPHLTRRILHQVGGGSKSGPPMPRSSAILQQRIASIATPALFGESSTERRISRFIGTSPNPRHSMRRKHTLLSFCQGTKSDGPMWMFSGSSRTSSCD